MTDIIDQAQKFDAMNLQQALDAQRRAAENTARITANGTCQNPVCGEEFGDHSPRLFCGPKCAEQHQFYTSHR